MDPFTLAFALRILHACVGIGALHHALRLGLHLARMIARDAAML